MIDFHSHILPNVDDGSTSVEETINILKEAQEVGFSKIISTSHYIEEYYEYNEKERMILLENIKKSDKNLEILLGSEIYITENIVNLVKEKKASTINNSKYILFELPMNNKTIITKETIYRIIENEYVPIIAHPERYSYVQEKPEYVEELSEMGALFQANYGSIIGMYGEKAKKTVKKLLKQNLIKFLGSDVHRTKQIYPKIPQIIKKLKKIIPEYKIEELVLINPQKVLDNKEIK